MHRTEHSSLRQGLVGCWVPSLGASGLSLIDRSGRNNHGTLTNMGGQDNWRASGSGVALNFDGTNDFAAIPASSAYSAVVWFSLWFRITSALTPATRRYTLAFSNAEAASPFRQSLAVGFNIIGQAPSEGTGRLNVITFDSTATPTLSGAYSVRDFSSAVGEWIHVSGGWNGSAWQLLVNGAYDFAPQGTQRASTASPTTPAGIGGSASRYSPVMLDDIRFYNRALTLAEIRLLASRRGIGLTPLPDRAAGLPRRFSVNVGGTWRAADSYLNVGGDWRLGQPSVNVGGTWK